MKRRLNKRGSVFMESTDPGEPTNGHDSIGVGRVNITPFAQKGNRFNNERKITKTLIDSHDKEIQRLRNYIVTHPAHDDQFFIDIITTALEGGIGYWSVAYKYDCDAGLATIRAIDEEGEPEGPKYRINPEKLKAAWVDIVTNPDLIHIQDWDDLDSGDCDNIIQILLFGKTIYG